MADFFSYIESIIPVSAELKRALDQCIIIKELSKGEIVLRAKEKCHFIYFIESGLLRGYYFNEEKEITHWFARENEFATCFYAFITRESSLEYIQALEDSKAVAIRYEDLQLIYKNFPETERIGRLITEQYYIRLESRLLGLQFTTAKERYQKLEETQADLLQRVSLGQIAAYLGISQETLSRIRAGQ